MKITKAEFMMSNSKLSACPKPSKAEYAFIGRSNVGKSSLINMITDHKKLAKVSGRPGKTQLINHFEINDDWYLVDLPGYGYAKVSKANRAVFHKMITQYLEKRENLMNVFVLLDSRLDPQKIDLEFMKYLGSNSITFSMIFTKMDKISSREMAKNQAKYKKKMLEVWEELPPVFLTSSTSKTGKEKLLNYIGQINTMWDNNIANK
jgi:GTP-binding protein